MKILLGSICLILRANDSVNLGCLWGRACRFSAALSILVYSTTVAATDWNILVESHYPEIVSNTAVQKLFVSVPIDAGRNKSYYPFLDRVHRALQQAARNHGQVIAGAPLSADHYLQTEFQVNQKALSLFFSLKTAGSREIVSSTMLEMDTKSLPSDWKTRNLNDVAYELVGKLEERLFGQQIQVTIGEFSGGKTQTAGLVSEFSQLMRDNVREELGRLNMFQILTSDNQASADCELVGQFQVTGNEIVFRLKAIRRDKKSEIANISARFPFDSVPDGVSLYPKNKEVAETTVDPAPQVDPSESDVVLWVNREDRTYRDNDPLIVYLRPNENVYVRVYYIQTDGQICQLLPLGQGETGYIRKDRIRAIGDAGDDVMLTISDSTLGQETIKVFASRGPIEDKSLPVKFHPSAKLNCVVGDYPDLLEALTRAIKAEYVVRLAAEVKILVIKEQ
jgi:hypothetical protein